MAVSPLVYRSDEQTEPKPNESKVKSLAVRANSTDRPHAKSQVPSHPGPDLAEQLNQELKEKYVKGETMESSVVLLLTFVQIRKLEKVHMPLCTLDISAQIPSLLWRSRR